ncbi:3-hydroxyacyl-[acyl-carrier-protein] dehydratase [Deinobacterium chartae]|uniref:3-hydroxyacyl-[acyl-carrier-protein] dehydratase FabZ n=1 Tax=Deinobacterium chartae TaxID=521158 RepID=A0A841I0F4_9DEIO|nr:3-hydroxyacyl-ACP dehydratase FabZ [Deinobacterium chartae]MBB6099137.1 3-hydroxyacyl-[acyl-carrier-protein] dehydratase [Deinobacterium chartae]
MLDIKDILAQLPHRYPFLLVDRVLSHNEAQVHALKNVTMNEPFFQGHFPGQPIMPGVLIIEALAQASVFLLYGKIPQGQVAFLAGVDGVRIKKQVTPGDQLHLHANLEFFRRGVGKVNAEARVDGELVTQAQLLFALAQG